MKLIVTEDEDALRTMVANRLRKMGHTVFAAANLTEARNLLESTAPDIALLDLNLPDGSGFTLLPDLRAANPAIRILIMSAYIEDERQMAIDRGVDIFLAKPFSMATLLEAVNKLAGTTA